MSHSGFDRPSEVPLSPLGDTCLTNDCVDNAPNSSDNFSVVRCDERSEQSVDDVTDYKVRLFTSSSPVFQQCGAAFQEGNVAMPPPSPPEAVTFASSGQFSELPALSTGASRHIHDEASSECGVVRDGFCSGDLYHSSYLSHPLLSGQGRRWFPSSVLLWGANPCTVHPDRLSCNEWDGEETSSSRFHPFTQGSMEDQPMDAVADNAADRETDPALGTCSYYVGTTGLNNTFLCSASEGPPVSERYPSDSSCAILPPEADVRLAKASHSHIDPVQHTMSLEERQPLDVQVFERAARLALLHRSSVPSCHAQTGLLSTKPAISFSHVDIEEIRPFPGRAVDAAPTTTSVVRTSDSIHRGDSSEGACRVNDRMLRTLPSLSPGRSYPSCAFNAHMFAICSYEMEIRTELLREALQQRNRFLLLFRMGVLLEQRGVLSAGDSENMEGSLTACDSVLSKLHLNGADGGLVYLHRLYEECYPLPTFPLQTCEGDVTSDVPPRGTRDECEVAGSEQEEYYTSFLRPQRALTHQHTQGDMRMARDISCSLRPRQQPRVRHAECEQWRVIYALRLFFLEHLAFTARLEHYANVKRVMLPWDLLVDTLATPINPSSNLVSLPEGDVNHSGHSPAEALQAVTLPAGSDMEVVSYNRLIRQLLCVFTEDDSPLSDCPIPFYAFLPFPDKIWSIALQVERSNALHQLMTKLLHTPPESERSRCAEHTIQITCKREAVARLSWVTLHNTWVELVRLTIPALHKLTVREAPLPGNAVHRLNPSSSRAQASVSVISFSPCSPTEPAGRDSGLIEYVTVAPDMPQHAQTTSSTPNCVTASHQSDLPRMSGDLRHHSQRDRGLSQGPAPVYLLQTFPVASSNRASPYCTSLHRWEDTPEWHHPSALAPGSCTVPRIPSATFVNAGKGVTSAFSNARPGYSAVIECAHTMPNSQSSSVGGVGNSGSTPVTDISIYEGTCSTMDMRTDASLRYVSLMDGLHSCLSMHACSSAAHTCLTFTKALASSSMIQCSQRYSHGTATTPSGGASLFSHSHALQPRSPRCVSDVLPCDASATNSSFCSPDCLASPVHLTYQNRSSFIRKSMTSVPPKISIPSWKDVAFALPHMGPPAAGCSLTVPVLPARARLDEVADVQTRQQRLVFALETLARHLFHSSEATIRGCVISWLQFFLCQEQDMQDLMKLAELLPTAGFAGRAPRVRFALAQLQEEKRFLLFRYNLERQVSYMLACYLRFLRKETQHLYRFQTMAKEVFLRIWGIPHRMQDVHSTAWEGVGASHVGSCGHSRRSNSKDTPGTAAEAVSELRVGHAIPEHPSLATEVILPQVPLQMNESRLPVLNGSKQGSARVCRMLADTVRGSPMPCRAQFNEVLASAHECETPPNLDGWRPGRGNGGPTVFPCVLVPAERLCMDGICTSPYLGDRTVSLQSGALSIVPEASVCSTAVPLPSDCAGEDVRQVVASPSLMHCHTEVIGAFSALPNSVLHPLSDDSETYGKGSMESDHQKSHSLSSRGRGVLRQQSSFWGFDEDIPPTHTSTSFSDGLTLMHRLTTGLQLYGQQWRESQWTSCEPHSRSSTQDRSHSASAYHGEHGLYFLEHEYKNGDVYYGHWHGNVRCGLGMYRCRKPCFTYFGDWKEDVPHGDGILLAVMWSNTLTSVSDNAGMLAPPVKSGRTREDVTAKRVVLSETQGESVLQSGAPHHAPSRTTYLLFGHWHCGALTRTRAFYDSTSM